MRSTPNKLTHVSAGGSIQVPICSAGFVCTFDQGLKSFLFPIPFFYCLFTSSSFLPSFSLPSLPFSISSADVHSFLSSLLSFFPFLALLCSSLLHFLSCCSFIPFFSSFSFVFFSLSLAFLAVIPPSLPPSLPPFLSILLFHAVYPFLPIYL